MKGRVGADSGRESCLESVSFGLALSSGHRRSLLAGKRFGCFQDSENADIGNLQ